jgi:putative acetyltransferase
MVSYSTRNLQRGLLLVYRAVQNIFSVFQYRALPGIADHEPMIIREEQAADIDAIWQLNSLAFETETEARLVNALRESSCAYLSLVAQADNEIIGHILFTPVELRNGENRLKIMGLAPMAVLPGKQNKGVGSKLVKSGLQQCRSQGYDAVVVLGHAGYYPRFGFKPSVNFGIKSEYDVLEDVFMVLELKPGVLKGHHGIIKYQPAFNSV